ncbi:MAG: hypothetical protein M0P19_08480 [Nevskia sp.]|jgi:hypothetical protein|nr:hypothetical protein [Nevskia sp.]MCK9384752.1 hypothetical protein [Nevskia sp.]
MLIRTQRDAIAAYMAQGISNLGEARAKRDKGVRLVEYSKSARIANTRFSWVSEGGRQWRGRVVAFASIVAEARGLDRAA